MPYDDVVRVSPRAPQRYVDEQITMSRVRGGASEEYVQGMPPMQGGGYYNAPLPPPYYGAPPPQPPYYAPPGYYPPPPPPDYYDAPYYPPYYDPEIIPYDPVQRSGDVYVDDGSAGRYDDGVIRKPAPGGSIDVTVHDAEKPKPGPVKRIFSGAAPIIGAAGFLALCAGAASLVFGSHSIGGLGHMASIGHGGPGTLLVGGAAAALFGGALWRWNHPKDL